LDQAEEEIKNIFSDFDSKEFLVFHPAWGYFADNFGLKQIPIEVEGKEPDLKYLNKIITYAKREKIEVIFVQEQFSKKQANAVAEQINAKIIEIDPLAENYLENLKEIARLLSNI